MIFVAGWLSCDSVEAPAGTKDATGIDFPRPRATTGFLLYSASISKESAIAKAYAARPISRPSLLAIGLPFAALKRYEFIRCRPGLYPGHQ